MDYYLPPRITGLNITVGSFLPRLQLPSLAGPMLTPADMVEENGLAVCIYNPTAVNPFPIPPQGIDLPSRINMLHQRDITLYVISGLDVGRLASWTDMIGMNIHVLSDSNGEFTKLVGIPLKLVDGRNFRTHVSFILQEERVLSILLETDPIHDFERLLTALDVAEGREPTAYDLPDKPWYMDQYSHQLDSLDEDDFIVDSLYED